MDWRHDRAMMQIGADAGADGAGGTRERGAGEVSHGGKVWGRAAAIGGPTVAGSAKKASWPHRVGSSMRRLGPPRRLTRSVVCTAGTSVSPSAATTVVGTRTAAGSTRWRSAESDSA